MSLRVKLTMTEYDQLKDTITNLQNENRRLRQERDRFLSFKAINIDYPEGHSKLVSFRLSDVVSFKQELTRRAGNITELTLVWLSLGNHNELYYYHILTPYREFEDMMYEYTNGFY